MEWYELCDQLNMLKVLIREGLISIEDAKKSAAKFINECVSNDQRR